MSKNWKYYPLNESVLENLPIYKVSTEYSLAMKNKYIWGGRLLALRIFRKHHGRWIEATMATFFVIYLLVCISIVSRSENCYVKLYVDKVLNEKILKAKPLAPPTVVRYFL